jgi:glycosyltransferase involved in cell wall biosynthesis
MTTFSIIIPNYNSGELLEKAIQSCIEQKYTDWELIVIDNNSNDKSRHVVEKYHDTRIKQIQINNNGVIAASRNLGASVAEGEYLAFLDADDTWYPNKLFLIWQAIERGKYDFIYHKLKRVPKRKYIRPTIGSRYRNSQTDILMAGNRIPNSSVVMKRSIFSELNGFDESLDLVASEDFDLWIRVNMANFSIEFIAVVLGTYYESATGMNASHRRITSAIAILQKHGKELLPGWFLLSQILDRTDINIDFEKNVLSKDKLETYDTFVHFSDYVYYKCRKAVFFGSYERK